jgi:flavin reductase (DIM6/NTAB) family NADH-FMN oxidoreductase RutF
MPYDLGVKRSLDEIDARRLLTGGPITLVTSGYRGRHNIMPVAYAMTASIVPPLIAIAVSPSRYSYDIIHKTEEFALNIPSRALLHHVQYLGSISGVDFDKIELTKLPTTQARRIDTVLLEGCVGWIECGLKEEYEVGDHRLLIGQVVAASADDDAFNERWLLQDEDAKPLHYLGANFYSTLSGVLEARIPQRAEDYDRKLQEAVDETLELTRDAEEQREEAAGEQEEFRRREGFDRPLQ